MRKQLAHDASAQGLPDLAALLSTLDEGLIENAFDVPSGPAPAPRLGRFVYPVV